MQYHIFCKETHKYLCTYTNAESLKTLDTARCYYKEVNMEAYEKIAPNTYINMYNARNTNRNKTSSNHSYYSQSYSHTSSDSCSSDPSSGDSSSSCDYGSY